MSHPTQTLRDKVWSVLNNVWVGDSEEDLYIKTDAILDLVRERVVPEVSDRLAVRLDLVPSELGKTVASIFDDVVSGR